MEGGSKGPIFEGDGLGFDSAFKLFYGKDAFVLLSGHSSFRDDLQDQTDFYAIQSSCGKGRAYQLLVLEALLALAPSQTNSRNNNI